MKNQEKDIDLITRFFDLALSDDELADLEVRLSKDIEFKQKFYSYNESTLLVNKTYQSPSDKLRTQKWKKLLSNNQINTDQNLVPTKKNQWKWVYRIAAGFILTFSIWQLSLIFLKPNIDQLTIDSWNKKIGLNFNTTRSSTTDSLKQQISLAYNTYTSKKYQTTLNILSNYTSSMEYYEDVLLLKGLSNYKKGNINNALKTLDTLANYPTGKKSKVAKWYQGLIYLDQNNLEAAKEFLLLPKNNTQEIKLKE